MKNLIYWNRRMWVFCVILLQVACCDQYCDKETIDHDVCDFLTPFFPDLFGSATSRKMGGVIEENLGQADAQYRLYVPGHGGGILFADNTIALALNKSLIRLDLVGANASLAEAEDQRITRVNYFVGSDASKWVRGARTYGRVRYRSVYPGVDMVFHGASQETGELEQDFIVAKGADPSRIRMRFSGTDRVERAPGGKLKLHAGRQAIEWQAPVVYQHVDGGRRQVRSAYRIHPNGEVGFELGPYRTDRPIIIDPVISFSTFTGTAGNDMPGRLVTDAQGNAYTVGTTNDYVFPSSAGAYKANTPGAYDIYSGAATITKIDPTGTKALYITHIGSTVQTFAIGLALDAAGNIYIAGHTQGTDYPTTPGAFQTSIGPNDPMAAFVTKLNAAGDQLIYSTYLNGSNIDGATAIAVDSQGNAYVAGETDSRDFPITGGALQQTLRPTAGSGLDSDGFITKLSPDGKKVIYSTYFGGGGTDLISALAIDAKGDVFVTGATTSVDLPTTPGAALTKFSGSSSNATFMVGDAFVAEINPAGSALVYSTYLGGKQDDIAFSIALDTGGNAYVTGSTLSTDFPTTSGAFQTAYKGAGGENNFPCGDAFVTKVNATGGLVYSTYLGGTMDDRGFVIAVDGTGSAWVAGNTISKNFPLTPDAHQSVFGGLAQGQGIVLGDAFVARLNPAGNALLYSSYHGGSGNEAAVGLALTPDGGVLVSGTTSSRDIKVTAGVYEPRPYGGDLNLAPMLDGFLFKLSFPPPPPAVTISSIANEASLKTGGVSPGMVVSISGSNLAAAATSADLTLSRLPFSLGQTRVLFDGLAAGLISVSPTQIVAIAPYRLLAGMKTQVVVDWNGNQSAASFLVVSASSPGLYANRVQNADGSPNSPDNPASPASIVTVAGTGDGQTAPPGVDGLILTADVASPVPVLPVSTMLGDGDAAVAAIGGIVGEPAGRFQMQVVLPQGLDPGDYPLIVQVGDSLSTSITVSIGDSVASGSVRHRTPAVARQGVKHK